MNKKTTKTIILVSLIAIAAIAVIYFFPLSQKTHIVFNGYEVSTDGTVISEQQIVLTANKYDFLLKEDGYHSIKIEVNEMTCDPAPHSHYDIPFYTEERSGLSYDNIHFVYYNTSSNMMCPCDVLLDSNKTWISLCVDAGYSKHYYVGSVQEDFEFADIWAIAVSKFNIG